MILAVKPINELTLGGHGSIVAGNHGGTSFTVSTEDRLLALDPSLAVLAEWPVGPLFGGHHATWPERGLALLSGRDHVQLLDLAGRVRWEHPHLPWSGRWPGTTGDPRGRGHEYGGAWFGPDGRAYALVPAPAYNGCLVLRFDLGSGRVTGQAAIAVAPAGVRPVHQPGGWVGIDVVEGRNGPEVWWVRPATGPAAPVELLSSGWEHEILADVDPGGAEILTLPHLTSTTMRVRSFPALGELRAIRPPEGCEWAFTACLAGDLIITQLRGEGGDGVAIDRDGELRHLPLGEPEGQAALIAGPDGSFLVVGRTRIRQWQVPPSRWRQPALPFSG